MFFFLPNKYLLKIGFSTVFRAGVVARSFFVFVEVRLERKGLAALSALERL